MQDLIKFILLLIIMLVLLKRSLNLGLVMMISSLLIALFYMIEPLVFIDTVFHSIIEKDTLTLLVLLVLISYLEKLLNQSGQLEKMILSLERYFPQDRIRLTLMPAFFGFLASPGGAMFSAPFVQKAAEPLGISPERKTFINYWFRHLWEYVLPTYPGVLLAVSLLNIEFFVFFKIVYVYTIAAVLIGIIFGLMPIKTDKKEGSDTAVNGRLIDLLLGILPIAVLLVSVIVFKFNIILTLTLILIIMLIYYKIPVKKAYQILKSSISYKILLSVIGIFIFKDVLKVSTMAKGLSDFFSQTGIHESILFLILPLTVGFLTGAVQAAVGITFPILIDLVNPRDHLNLFGFAFVAGVCGVFLSPTHLCLVLTVEYFEVKLTKVYKILFFPVLALIATAVVYTFFMNK